LGYQLQGGPPAAGQVKIVEDSMGGSGLSGAIGKGQQDLTQQAIQLQQNTLANSLSDLMQDGTQIFSGGSQIRSPFQYASAEGKIYDKERGTFWERQSDGTYVEYDGYGKALGIGTPKAVESLRVAPPPKPESESSPHDAILKPSRKLKLAAE
jgi:hypothetical protein